MTLQVCVVIQNNEKRTGILQGVVAAADDPPETTIEPHLEMSYNRQMPGDNIINVRKGEKTLI